MVLPDHPTPIVMRTHSSDPVPFMIYSSDKKVDGVSVFSEDSCKDKNFYIENGYNLLSHMIEKAK